jgi:hypothetical protein
LSFLLQPARWQRFGGDTVLRFTERLAKERLRLPRISAATLSARLDLHGNRRLASGLPKLLHRAGYHDFASLHALAERG